MQNIFFLLFVLFHRQVSYVSLDICVWEVSNTTNVGSSYQLVYAV